MSLFNSKNSENSVFSELSAQSKQLEEMRKFRHDYKNILWGLKVLLDKGEYDRANAYLAEITDSFENANKNKCSFSDNTMIDAVLQNVAECCLKHDIAFDGAVTVGKELPLSDAQICSVFCNIADNAVEAVQRQDENTDRFISFSSSLRAKWLIITAENSFNGIISGVGGDIATSKDDKLNHGIGLKSIASVVETIPGAAVKTEIDEDIFRIIMIFPRRNKIQ